MPLFPGSEIIIIIVMLFIESSLCSMLVIPSEENGT